MDLGGQRHTPAAFTPGKDPVPIVQEAGWASGPVWTGVENLAPTGIRSPDRPARRQSLYRLSYRAHSFRKITTGNNTAGLINPYVISNVVWKPDENQLGLEREREPLLYLGK